MLAGGFVQLRKSILADLEKKSVSSPLLVTGRTLLAMAKKGNRFYKRALSFAEQKWDTSKCQPKESGTTLDDVISFVCQGMYDYINRSKDDSSDDNDEVNEDADEGASSNINSDSPSKNKDNNENSDASDESIVEVPDDFIFPGFMAFRLWGPFASPENRLLLFENDDAPKNAAAP